MAPAALTQIYHDLRRGGTSGMVFAVVQLRSLWGVRCREGACTHASTATADGWGHTCARRMWGWLGVHAHAAWLVAFKRWWLGVLCILY
jgi:hypothetical protein